MDYRCITELKEIESYIEGAGEVAFDFETAPREEFRHIEYAALDPHRSDIVGISLSVREGSAVYIPLRHKIGSNADFEEVINLLKERVFLNENIIKIAHNMSFEAMFLYKHNIVLQAPVYDTIAASQLTLKNAVEFRNLGDSGLKTLVPELLGIELPKFSEVTDGRHFDELPAQQEETVRYACADSDFTMRLYHHFNSWFRGFIPRHETLVREVESPTSVFVGLMKFNGIKVDLKLIQEKQLEAEHRLYELKASINKLAGRNINIGANASTEDFKKFLYSELRLPILKTTAKSREAADEEALILLKEWCSERRSELVEFLEKVLEYRKWSKLKSTYINGIVIYVCPETTAVHADFFPLGTETGRFASRKPNLQNLPRKGSDPIGIRNFFRARQGHVFLDFDLSQIELRVGAYYCRDEKMLRTYRQGGDIHGQTTAVIYKIPFEVAVNKGAENYKERRVTAKNCNFGVFYGLFPKGLQKTLHFKAGLTTSLLQCEGIIYNLKKGYPGLSRWQEEAKRTARLKAYSETALGRRRYLKGINSLDFGVKSYWERCALNTPIQGTAADILKLAIGRIIKGMVDYPYLRPILQIHDEIMFEVPLDKVSEAAAFIKECMEAVPFEGFDVPIVAEGAVGESFGELIELEDVILRRC
jgi:DNA polymerase I